MDDLVAWLLAQIAEDEAALTGPHRLDNEYCSDGAHWTDERVLAECEAKRRVIKLYENALSAHRAGSVSDRNRIQDEAAMDVLGAAVQAYGEMYASLGRPGYQESWRPA